VIHCQHTLISEGDKPLTNIVFMGIGEPMLNFANLTKSLEILCAKKFGLGFSRRRITVSTVGIIRKIKELAQSGFGVKLAVSLHAADDELRKKLVPSAKASVEEIIETAHDYFLKTKRIVTIEYLLIKGVNSSVADAHKLAKLLAPFNFKVNLIAYNPVSSLPYESPSPSEIAEFAGTLSKRGIKALLRKSMGKKISAACGQLRAKLEVKS